MIFEDGKEVVTVSTFSNTDFSHGWSSRTTHRMYRVEVNLNVTGELVFVFSVDGVPYIDFPQKSMIKSSAAAKVSGGGRYGDEVVETGHVRRASTGAIMTANTSNATANRNGQGRSSATATSKTSENSFDPFAANGSDASFDPFAGDFASSSATTTKTTPKPPATKTTPNTQTSKANAAEKKSVGEKKSSAASLFDEIPDSPNDFDTFSASNDPFASSASTTSATQKPAASASASLFDPFESSEPVHKPASSSAAFDPFATPSTHNGFDSIGFTSTPAAPARRSSAAEISQDLAGLSFTAPAPAPVVAVKPSPEPVKVAPAEPVKPVEEIPKDPWNTNLVDLDLTGKSTAVRRTSQVQAGPSLDNLMGNTSNGPRKSIGGNGLQSSMNDPFGAPPLLQTSNNNGFNNGSSMGFAASSVPMMPRPMSSADAISSLGARPTMPPMAPAGFGNAGGAYGGPGMNNTRASFNAGPGSMGMGMGAPMGAPSMGMGMGAPRPMGAGMGAAPNPMMGGNIGRSSFIMQPQSGIGSSNNSNNQPKNSLDSLDWRA